jgi:hypothetical protein
MIFIELAGELQMARIFEGLSREFTEETWLI